MASDESLGVVLFSMVLNITLAVLKFLAYLLTGSPSMLAQTYHSISDTGNQVLLLIGMYYAKKSPDRLHPFGYGKSVFFYSFLVAVLLFGIAGWESLKTGAEALRADGPVKETGGSVTALGREFRAVYLAYAVLVVTILFDVASYVKAQQALSAEADERGWVSFRDSFRKTSDMPVLAVLTENGVASVGAFIALVAIFIADVTGVHVFDAAGAVLIGVLLMSFAIAFGWENKRLLLGEALPEGHEEPLEDAVEDVDGVERVVDLRTVYFGPENVLVTADVSFDPSLSTEELEQRIDEIEDGIREEEPLVRDVYVEIGTGDRTESERGE